ncbi:MAG: hypothetical protein AB2L12_01350 [Smithellaceae bacterium]
MNKDLLKKDRYEIAKHQAKHDVEILDPVRKASPFINFRYSYKEISSIGGKTQIRSKEKSFENGNFKSEEFEGTLDGNVYSNIVGEIQKQFLNQMASFIKPFSMFLPFGGSKKKNK